MITMTVAEFAAMLAAQSDSLVATADGGEFAVDFTPGSSPRIAIAKLTALRATKIQLDLAATQQDLPANIAVWQRHIRHALGVSKHGRIVASYARSAARMIELIDVGNLRRELR